MKMLVQLSRNTGCCFIFSLATLLSKKLDKIHFPSFYFSFIIATCHILTMLRNIVYLVLTHSLMRNLLFIWQVGLLYDAELQIWTGCVTSKIKEGRIHGNFVQLDLVDWMILMTLSDTIHFTVLVASYTEKAPPLLFCLNLLWARDCSWMALARAVMVEILIESSRGSFSSPSSVFSFVRPLFISILLLLHFHRPLNILIITSSVPELQ